MSKYGDNIRRIARVKTTESTTTKDDAKPEIPGKRGVAVDESGKTTTFTSTPGSAGVTERAAEIIADLLKGEASDDLKKALQQALNIDEDSGELEDSPESAIKAGAIGNASIDDIIDGNVPLAQENSTTDNGLFEITDLEDIITGDTFSVRLDGQYPPPAATSAGIGVPNATSEWESSITPPTALDWVSGAFFTIAHSGGTLGTYFTNRYSEAIDWDITNTGIWASFYDWTTKSGGSGGAPNYPNATDLATISGTNGNVAYSFSILRTTDSPGVPTGSATVNMFACNMPTPPQDLTAYCSVSDVLEDKWPVGSETVLALASDGLIKSSQFDVSSVGQAYRDGTGIIVADFAGGTRKAVLEPGKDNTTLIYEIDSNFEPTGNVRVYTRGKIADVLGGNVFAQTISQLTAIDSTANLSKYRTTNQINRIIRATGVEAGKLYRP